MSLRHSPPAKNSESSSDLRVGNVTSRKKKTSENDVTVLIAEFRREIKETLSDYKEEVHKSFSEIRQDLLSTFKTHLDNQNDILYKLREDFCDVKNEISAIKQTNNKLQQEQTQLKSALAAQKRDYDATKSKVIDLERDLADAKRSLSTISEQLSLKDQQGRINNLEITGVPVSRGENLNNIITKLAVKVGLALTPFDIDYIHRVRRFNPSAAVKVDGPPSSQNVPNIIVRFSQRKRKSDMLAAIRARRGLTTADLDLDGPARPVFVNDHLAPHNKMLYGRVRRLGKELGYKYIWVNDCKIFVRKSDTSKAILISNEADLIKIK